MSQLVPKITHYMNKLGGNEEQNIENREERDFCSNNNTPY